MAGVIENCREDHAPIGRHIDGFPWFPKIFVETVFAGRISILALTGKDPSGFLVAPERHATVITLRFAEREYGAKICGPNIGVNISLLLTFLSVEPVIIALPRDRANMALEQRFCPDYL